MRGIGASLSSGGTLRFGPGDFEDLVHFVYEESILGIRKVTVGIEVFEVSGGGFGAGLAVLLEVEGFARGARQGVDEASKVVNVTA